MLIVATQTGYSAHVLPGCIATGQTVEQVKQRMQKRWNSWRSLSLDNSQSAIMMPVW